MKRVEGVIFIIFPVEGALNATIKMATVPFENVPLRFEEVLILCSYKHVEFS